MRWQTAYIGLGSNLEQPWQQIQKALRSINDTDGIKLVQVSPVYQSTALILSDHPGIQHQPDYLNAVAEIQTQLSADQVLQTILNIELYQGRRRGASKGGARTIDLDLLLYGESEIQTPVLTVPHPGLIERAFVVKPLHDIAPMLMVPGHQISLASLVQSLDLSDLKVVHPPTVAGAS